MRIGILSFTSSENNYGQLLQCYGLQTFLRKQGHKARHIRYVPVGSKLDKLSSPSRIAEYLKTYLSWRFVVNLSRKARYRGDDEQRCFDTFRSETLETTPIVYHSIDELRADPPEEDVLIAGSDQIWGSSLYDPNTAGWFLGFGDERAKRLSYAASIGRELSDEDLPQFGKYILGLDAVSVREQKASEICKRCGVEAKVVLDPTLLLEASDYRSLSATCGDDRKPKKPYLFAYVLNVLFAKDIHWRAFERFAVDRGLEVAPVYSSGYYSAYPIIRGCEPLYPTIPEWLNLVEGASAVVTTSFHGVVFSILFERPFLALALPGKQGRGNDRVSTLLHSLGLESRMFDPLRSVSEQMDAPIDWVEVRRRLSELREGSIGYLRDALA